MHNMRIPSPHQHKQSAFFNGHQWFLQTLKERISHHKSPIDTDTEATLRCVERQLRSNRSFWRIQQVMDPSPQQALTRIKVTRTVAHINPHRGGVIETEQTILVNTRAELEATILTRNKKHFAKANGSPFTTFPLNRIGGAQDFELLIDGHSPQQLMSQGSFPETHAVLDALQEAANNPPPTWSNSLSFEDFIKGFLKWNESTLTSPSGRHLGIYKTLVTAYIDSSGEFMENEGTPIKYEAEDILRLIFGLATAAS